MVGDGSVDVVIVGGGMAGVSVGYFLAESGMSVALVEAEPTLAFHTTGRSAAQYLENYGDDVVRRLTAAGRPFFAEPPEQFCDTELWSPRPMMRIGGPELVDHFRAEVTAARTLVPSTEFLDGATAVERHPAIRPELVAGAIYEPDAMDLDVAGLHQLFVRGLRHHGGAIHVSSPVVAAEPSGSGWRITAGDLVIDCGVVINASGAWADQVASMAGVEPIGLHALRRTAFVARVPDRFDPSTWPLTDFESPERGMEVYCKPESGGLLVSPADETPSDPCDARPEELDIAMAIDRINTWTTLDVRSVSSSWAGLRTFTANRSLVAGFAPDAPGFFWLAGQGGYGIQTAPGLGRAASALIQSGSLPADIADRGVTPEDLSADRPELSGDLIAGH